LSLFITSMRQLNCVLTN